MILRCTSLLSEEANFQTIDNFAVSFKAVPQITSTNPCVNDFIEFQSLIQDFTYYINYPGQQLTINTGINQQVLGCPIECELRDQIQTLPLPSTIFTTYENSSFFTILANDAALDG